MAWNFARTAGKARGDAADAGPTRALAPAEALDFFRAIENLGGTGFWATDAKGCITYCSAALAERIGRDAGSLAGRSLGDVFTNSEADSGARSLSFLLTRRSRFERVVVVSGQGDRRRWWQLSAEARHEGEAFAGFFGTCSEITDERRAAEESASAAMHDPLTGLLNRRQMAQLLERTLSAYLVQKRACAVLLIDLDRFKQINDTLGHATGDALLQQVAERLRTMQLGDAHVGRLGGDEFQIMLPGIEDRGDLGALAERVIAMLSQPYSVDGRRCMVGASVGIGIGPFDGESGEDLARNAELALYAAKHGGRGGFRFFSRELLTSAEYRKALEEDLHDALARGEFELQYQPIVRCDTDKVCGVEALIRWNHPERGLIGPDQFIPIAEESGHIRQIGEWAVRTACRQAAQWPGGLRVAVNISPLHLVEPGFTAMVTNAVAAAGLRPDRLELEITESVFLAGGPDTDACFRALKALGVRLALDDFGTGYSSLASLRSAPFDKIKIDRSFVRGATGEGSRNRAIIAAIVALAEALEMETTAEGIETMDQLALLRELRVSHAQGYIYLPAIAADAVMEAVAGDGDWGIVPEGPERQRGDRISLYRWVGVIHEDYYYPMVMRNLSATGALLEGLENVPQGTQFIVYFGEGQLEIATVRRSMGEQVGVEFEKSLVNDGTGGLCTRTRISPYDLVNAGLPPDFEVARIRTPISSKGSKLSIPAFNSTIYRKAIPGTQTAA